MAQELSNREAVKEKVTWEGGLVAALEYGLTEEHMPEGDAELREAWRRLRMSFVLSATLAADVERLLGRL